MKDVDFVNLMDLLCKMLRELELIDGRLMTLEEASEAEHKR